jgi:hypothetical protein
MRHTSSWFVLLSAECISEEQQGSVAQAELIQRPKSELNGQMW